jgi:hypothetical protein
MPRRLEERSEALIVNDAAERMLAFAQFEDGPHPLRLS